jgi:hypothetical protein
MLPRTGPSEKDLIQNRFVPSTIRSDRIKENKGTDPETGTLPGDTFMNGDQARGVEAPIPRGNRLHSSEKTGSRQSCDCHTFITNNRYQ